MLMRKIIIIISDKKCYVSVINARYSHHVNCLQIQILEACSK